jgi:hypothetical protein
MEDQSACKKQICHAIGSKIMTKACLSILHFIFFPAHDVLAIEHRPQKFILDMNFLTTANLVNVVFSLGETFGFYYCTGVKIFVHYVFCEVLIGTAIHIHI